MDFVLAPPPQAAIEIANHSARFAIRRIFCVGRNYAEHVREMGNDLRDPPFYFTKPADAVVPTGREIPFPVATGDLHHEVELVLAIGQHGANIDPQSALDHIWGAAVGIDFTRRDLQTQAKKAGRPWDMAKGFDNSAPIGPLVQRSTGLDLTKGRIALSVNGETRQDGDLSEMIWPAADCIAHLSGLVELAPGDLIMTGTPAGVGSVVSGDNLSATIAGLPDLTVRLV